MSIGGQKNIRGDSATGKTCLYNMLEDLRLLEEYQAIKLFNYKSEEFHENLKKCRNRFVVVDNADLILDNEDRRYRSRVSFLGTCK